MSEYTYCGVNIAKHKGFKAMIRHLRQIPVHVALLEITGGLEA